jgi:hypothetical protein
MKRFIATALLGATLVVASASVAFATGPSDNHGADVSAVAKAADFVSGRAHGEAVSTLARTHGAEVSAAAREKAAANAANGKAKGEAASAAGAANGDTASETGRLKAAAASAAGLAHKP